jgi:hypothetical protein
MNEVAWLNALDRSAPAPEVASIDVTAGVMRAIHVRGAARDPDRVFPIAALIAATLGVTALVLAAPSWSPDPFAAFGEAVNLVLR